MSAFNSRGQRPAVSSPIASKRKNGFTTYEGANATARDAKGDLFVLGAGSFFGQNTFYEKGDERAQRFRALVSVCTAQDADWTARFLKWLRSDANIRTAAIVGAVEYARTVLKIRDNGGQTDWLSDTAKPRAVIRSVLQRADEPGEMIAYYTSLYGRAVPKPIKRGIADAVVGYRVDKPLYSEYSALKYDTASHGIRFADVLEIVHPTGEHPGIKGTHTSNLFQWLVDRRHGRDGDPAELGLGMVRRNAVLRKVVQDNPAFLLDAEGLKEAGMTWEDALSLAGSRVDKGKLWEAMIPSMGYMARLRNLRNFDEAGVSDSMARGLADDLANPYQVERSRQLPFRFWSAYKNAPSLRWAYALEQALDHSVKNVPELNGRTLILVDTSGSMQTMLSDKSSVRAVDAAALFGVALAKRGAQVDLYGFGDTVFRHDLVYGGSVLKQVEQFTRRIGEAGHGTNIHGAIQATLKGHDRVVIFSDMQTMNLRSYNQYGWVSGGNGVSGTVSSAVPLSVPMYAWNLLGYAPSMMETGTKNRHELGGFSDSAFSIMQRLEAGRDGKWSF